MGIFDNSGHTRAEDYQYASAEGLWVITPYFNPCGYKTRRVNYEAFASSLRRSGIPLLTVECAFGDQPFTLPESPDVIKIRSGSLLWQKERILDLTRSWLPRSCTGVAWIDCDLLFENGNWAVDLMKLLKQVPLVQLFESCNRLPEEGLGSKEKGDVCQSFASITPLDPSILCVGHYEKHGHVGYAWAETREIFDRHGLYEHAIIGSADHYMAHAAFGDIDGICVTRTMNHNAKQLDHFRSWAEPFYKDVNGRVAAVPGRINHLWHGDLQNRRYLQRNHELESHGFDPFTDLVANPGRPFEWAPGINKPELVEMFANYFASRKEDGSNTVTR